MRIVRGLLALTIASSSYATNGLDVVQNLSAPCRQYGGGSAITTSADGLFVYEQGLDAIANDAVIFVSQRNAGTGALTLVQTLGGQSLGASFYGTVEMVLSPDGEHLYALGGGLNVFDRDPASGLLTFVESDTMPAVYDDHGGLAISADGAHVYVARSGQLIVYARDGGSGALTQVEQQTLAGVVDIVLSPDGGFAYVTRRSPTGDVRAYARNPTSGALTFLAATSTPLFTWRLAISPDGATVYVVYTAETGFVVFDSGILVFDRDPGTGLLTLIDTEAHDDPGLSVLLGARRPVLSPNGAQLYVTVEAPLGVDGLLVFDRDPGDGSLDFAAQYVDQVGIDGLDPVKDLTITPDGDHLYAIGEGTVTFTRDGTTGTLTFLHDTEGTQYARGVTLSPDGSHAYRLCTRTIAAFDREGSSGLLTFTGEADLGPNVDDAGDVVPSPDGEHLYVVGGRVGTYGQVTHIVVLDRNPATGALAFVIDYPVPNPSGDIAISPDGANLYSVDRELGRLHVFARDSGSGMLTLQETHVVGGAIPESALRQASDLVVSPDGGSVYVSTYWSAATPDGIAIFARNQGNGALTFSTLYTVNGGGSGGLDGIVDLSLSPDATLLFAAGDFEEFGINGGIAVYARDASTGALSFSSSLRAGTALAGDIQGVRGVEPAPDGAHLYVHGQDYDAPGYATTVYVLRSDPTTGALGFAETAPDVEPAVYIHDDAGLAITPDGANLYVVETFGDLVALGELEVCSPSPQTSCVSADAAALRAAEKVGAGDLLKWKWKAPGPIAAGDPTASTQYAFCVYDASIAAQPVVSGRIDAGGTCGTKPCWTSFAAGYKYVDKAGSPDGITKLQLVTGSTGTAKIVLKGKGAVLAPLDLPYATPVVAQLQASNGECWEATYASAIFSDASQFKATD